MPLIYCPECGHEISNSAVACPNCGRPINATPVVERKVVVAHDRPQRDGIPTWAIATIAILGVLVLFVLFAMWGRTTEDEANQRVKVNMQQPSSANRQTLDSPSSVTTVPSTSSGSISVPSSQTTVPGSQMSVSESPTKGTVVIDAKVITKNNSQQPVRNERFYLLDKDLESILSEARIEPIQGQTLTNSLGLALMFPDKYGSFKRDALEAIKNHIKYAGTTDGSGRAQLGNVNPDNYYLFGMTKAGRGFAVWSSAVSINPGENVLKLTPLQLTEITDNAG